MNFAVKGQFDSFMPILLTLEEVIRMKARQQR
jgi:hypothetical protein